jgi:integrase
MPVFHRQKEGQNRIRWLTQDEELQIMRTLEQWGQIDVLEAFIVSVDTGIRYGEMLNIKAKDILKDGLYIGESKADISRLVPLTKRSREVLELRLKDKQPNDKLFDYAYQFHRSSWERLMNHLGFDDVVWHTLRHTTCSRLVQGGLPLPHVKEWMGHKAIVTTMRYAHLAPKHLAEGLNILEG